MKRIEHEGRPLLLAITLSPRQSLSFSVPASSDDIIAAYREELLGQLELLAARLRAKEYPFSFLGEYDD
jgi:hypothetical protein